MAERLYVGMDLGKSFHQVSVVDERKEEIGAPLRIKRGSTGIEKLLRQLKLYGAEPKDLVVTIEATGNFWNELVWPLTSRGCRVYLAQPKKAHDLRKFYRDHTKTDITDSAALARMPLVDVNTDLICPVFIGFRFLLNRRSRFRLFCRFLFFLLPSSGEHAGCSLLEEREAVP